MEIVRQARDRSIQLVFPQLAKKMKSRNPFRSTPRSRCRLLAATCMAIVSSQFSISQAQQPLKMPPQQSVPTQQAMVPSQRVPQSTPANKAADGPLLEVVNVPVDHAKAIGTAIGLRYRQFQNVQISTDAREGKILVMAPASLQSQITDDINRLVPPANDPGVQHAVGRNSFGQQAMQVGYGPGTVKLSLHRVGWQRFEDYLAEAAGRPIPVTTQRNGELATFRLVDEPLKGTTIEVDRRENAVTVFAPQPAISGWQKMIGSLEQGDLPPGAITQLVRVRDAEPAPIQRAIRLLGTLGDDQAAVVRKLPRDSVAAAAQQLVQNNQQPTADDDTDQLIGPDEDADGEAAGAGLIGDVQIQFVPELGIIVLKGSKRDVARVQEVISEIEAKSAITQPEVVIQQLEHVNSQALETLLRDLYTEVLSARQGEVSITSLDKPNALLLIGRQEAVNAAVELIEKLDVPVAPSTQLRVFRLEHASAVDAEETVRGFFVDRPGSDDNPRPNLGFRARVIADYRTNSLIIQASPRDMREVGKLIRELDIKNIESQNELRIVKLRNALAEDLVVVIRSTITGTEETPNPNANTPSSALSMVTLDAEGNQTINSGILIGTTVNADANSNTIIVRGPANSLPLVEALIRQLDQPPGNESYIKVFTLENGDSGQLTAALQQLFGVGAPTGGVGQANLAGLPPATAGTESSLVSLRFSSDIRTNSIIASGSASDLEVVESILLRLDTNGFADRMFEVVWLRNQYAPDVAEALQQFVTRRQTQLLNIQQAALGGLSPFDALERDVVVVAEPVSNSLVLSVAPRLYTTIRRMIDQLDRRAPMVLVKVVIAEVTLDDGVEFGAEFGLQNALQFDRGIANLPGAGDSNPQGLPLGPAPTSTPGFNFNNNGSTNVNSAGRGTLAERAVTSFGLGTSSGQFGFGGFVLSAASDSVSLLMRALQQSGRLQILSRPQLMTLDNSAGTVQVGAKVPRINGVIVNFQGNQIVAEDVDVGLILNIRPRVGRDGLIVMEVNAQRSAIDDTTGVPVGFGPGGEVINSPLINITSAESVVTAYSGQTVIYGGLIQKTRSQRSRRLPYVSNIPLLGALFRFDREIEVRSELLVVLTPMIVSSEEDLEYVKQTESARMSWCLPEVVEMHGNVGLSGGHGLWGPAVAPVIYPDMHPTIDDIEYLYQHGKPGTNLPAEMDFQPGPMSSGTTQLPQPPTPPISEAPQFIDPNILQGEDIPGQVEQLPELRPDS